MLIWMLGVVAACQHSFSWQLHQQQRGRGTPHSLACAYIHVLSLSVLCSTAVADIASASSFVSLY